MRGAELFGLFDSVENLWEKHKLQEAVESLLVDPVLWCRLKDQVGLFVDTMMQYVELWKMKRLRLKFTKISNINLNANRSSKENWSNLIQTFNFYTYN